MPSPEPSEPPMPGPCTNCKETHLWPYTQSDDSHRTGCIVALMERVRTLEERVAGFLGDSARALDARDEAQKKATALEERVVRLTAERDYYRDTGDCGPDFDHEDPEVQARYLEEARRGLTGTTGKEGQTP